VQRLIFLFLLLLTSHSFSQQKNETLRIMELLPYFVQPPMVDPCLPENFTLGIQETDPHFSKGYYWGTQTTLKGYFEDETALKGCLIRAQRSSTMKQLGYDRFSNDGDVQKLGVARFTEIKLNKGRWGVFPYRELLAKSPKGRHYYQLWVGLNTKEGATLYFQFIYPDYLNEPTQLQKTIWSNFVKKTDLMCLNDLVLAHSNISTSNFSIKSGLEEAVGLRIKKRKGDQKLLIQMENIERFSILQIKKTNIFIDFPLFQPLIEIKALLKLSGEEEHQETLRAPCQTVDRFLFESKHLKIDRFHEEKNLLLFY